MKNTLIIFALALSASIFAQDRSIEFKTYTFSEALQASKDQNKPIFMDCFTTWCGPCKWMSANIFTQNEVADYYNQNFICVKFDMEKGEGLELAKEFGIRAYPTLIFVNGERKLVMKSIGASREPADYIALGDNAKSDDFNLIALSENVSSHRNDADYMSKYFRIMSGANLVDPEEVRIYFDGIPKDEWASKDNWQIITSVVDDVQGEVFQDVLNNTEKYQAINGDQVDGFIAYKVQNALMTTLYSRKPNAAEEYNALLAEVKTWNFKGKSDLLFAVQSAQLKRQDPEAYLEFCINEVENAIWDDANQLNNTAWYFFENTQDANYLKAAEKWAERAAELNPAHNVLDTYANLLMANGNLKEALSIETKARDLANAQGADASAYEEVIAKIKEKM